MSSAVARSLEAGWDFQPDWRARTIDGYLVEIASAKDHQAALQKVLFSEPDPFVRQGLRLRFGGRCVHQRAIEWTFRAVRENAKTGLASRIRAAVIADRFPEEIAGMLHVEPAGIIAFEKLFWDVRRYLGCDLWLESLVQAAEEQQPTAMDEAREVVWLRAALREGWSGLERLWFRKNTGTDAKSLDELGREIEAIAARRALRHLQQLEERGEPVSDEDLKRLMIVSRRTSAPAEKGTNSEKLRTFYEQLLAVGNENILKNDPNGPIAQGIMLARAEQMALPVGSAGVQRLRMRVVQ